MSERTPDDPARAAAARGQARLFTAVVLVEVAVVFALWVVGQYFAR
jgi:hypothetical protein